MKPETDQKRRHIPSKNPLKKISRQLFGDGVELQVADPRIGPIDYQARDGYDKELLDLHFAEDFKYVLTTAFSRHPASMKYRGIFKMHKRIKDPDKYRINYYAEFGRHTLAEALAIWGKRYG